MIKRKSQQKLTEDQKETAKQYAKLFPEYKKLSQELKVLIKSLLNKAGIDLIEIIQ